ncbi:MAG: phosphatidylserine decarboxylase family protein [Paludibacteraceae bacterium]|nr:phosphatidylserine decarboxylase family protein [Paludibacteraceae bacterium]
MRIHKEGKGLLTKLMASILVVDAVVGWCCYASNPTFVAGFCLFSLLVFLFFLNFFRNPNRFYEGDSTGLVMAPADGTVVVIEPTVEGEYLKDERIQVSIFMSVFNVHANWYPVNGKILYYTHNDGLFWKANLPKSSTENERSTVVVETVNQTKVLFRQVAGALARRIVTYAKVGDECHINQQMGFIKFGSRVDIFLPKDAEILVNLKQKVVGNQTVIAKLNTK